MQDYGWQWHRVVPCLLWALREVPNRTTAVSPHFLLFGQVPRGPLSILKETWTGMREHDTVRNFPSAAVSAVDFGGRPGRAADAAHLLLLAGSQRGCSVGRAGALKVCLRSVEIFDWKD